MTDDTTQEAPEAPNPLDVIATALQGVSSVDPAVSAFAAFNAILTAPAETRRMVAAAILNTFAPGDAIIIVAEPPREPQLSPWWPMQPAPGVAEMVQAAIARESAVLAKGPFVTPAPLPGPPPATRKLRLV